MINGSGAVQSSRAREIFQSCGSRALILTGPNLLKSGCCQPLERVLRSEKIEYVFYSDICEEPDDKMVNDALEVYQKNRCNFLIALGGGSPMDLMKAVGTLAKHGGRISDYMEKSIDGELPPMVAIPTTAGTGSEATQFSIITDSDSQIKMLLKGRALMPKYAIIDPGFTLTMPPSVTAATGLDALCHCVEAYTSRKAQPLADTFAVSAVKRIFRYLSVCYKESNNEAARMQMSLAALEAGIAFNNASVTLIHGMSRPIGALFHIPHGISNAMLMEECLAYALPGAYERFAALGKSIGAAAPGDDEKTASEKFLFRVRQLKEELKIPPLSAQGVGKEQYFASLNKMAQDALDSGSPANTIREVSKEDMIDIYKRVWR